MTRRHFISSSQNQFSPMTFSTNSKNCLILLKVFDDSIKFKVYGRWMQITLRYSLLLSNSKVFIAKDLKFDQPKTILGILLKATVSSELSEYAHQYCNLKVISRDSSHYHRNSVHKRDGRKTAKSVSGFSFKLKLVFLRFSQINWFFFVLRKFLYKTYTMYTIQYI